MADKCSIDLIGEYLDDRFDVGCRLKTTSDQTISTLSTWIKVVWHTEAASGCWDHGGWWSSGSDLTVPAGEGGLVYCAAVLGIDSGLTSGGTIQARITNSSLGSPNQVWRNIDWPIAKTDFWLGVFGPYNISAGDNLYVGIHQSVTTSLKVKSGSMFAVGMVGRG